MEMRKRARKPQETVASGSTDPNKKTKYACIVEAHESTRKRLESTLPSNHEDHIAEKKGPIQECHYNLVHKCIPMPQAMKLPDAKAAGDKEWKKLEKLPAWQLDEVKSKKEVILDAQIEKTEVRFATLLDICHVKNAE